MVWNGVACREQCSELSSSFMSSALLGLARKLHGPATSCVLLIILKHKVPPPFSKSYKSTLNPLLKCQFKSFFSCFFLLFKTGCFCPGLIGYFCYNSSFCQLVLSSDWFDNLISFVNQLGSDWLELCSINLIWAQFDHYYKNKKIK